jgi:hypothetical protein
MVNEHDRKLCVRVGLSLATGITQALRVTAVTQHTTFLHSAQECLPACGTLGTSSWVNRENLLN